MTKGILRASRAALLMVVAACSGGGAAGNERGMAETAAPASQAELEAVNREFIDRYNQGDLEGFTAVYSDDAKLYPHGVDVLEGRAAITEFWRGAERHFGIRNVTLTTLEMEIDGDRAWEVGRASYDSNDGPVEGRYLVVWARQPDGQWRWHRDFMNAGAPGATP